MGLFDIFKKKKVELTEEQLKWNKMWELWTEEKVESPYAELMTYQSEINNGGHSQYFTNIENVSNIQKEMSQLEKILPPLLNANLQIAHQSYVKLEENDGNENSERILKRCDNTFFQNEEEINNILKKYASEIK